MSVTRAEAARELRRRLRNARTDGGLRCDRVEFYERFDELPGDIAEKVAESGAGGHQALMFAVAWRRSMFACIPVADQLATQANYEAVVRVLVQDLGAELAEA